MSMVCLFDYEKCPLDKDIVLRDKKILFGVFSVMILLSFLYMEYQSSIYESRLVVLP